jgi:hypothetical protein
MARLLKHVADANLYLQTRGINAVPLAPEHVFVENDGLTRLVNVAVAGTRSPLAHVADTQMLGHILEDLIRDDAEGATRVRTLLSWMADLERPLPLTWEQIQSYAEQVEQQLTAPTQTLPPAPTRQGKAAPKSQTPLVLGILAAAAVAVGLAVIISRNDNPKVPQERDLSATISVPQGSYATMDGASAELPAFQLDAFEVSIGEYRKFLDQLSALPDGQRNAYDHPEQPASKINHHPDGWDEMLAAAVAGSPWRDQLIDLNFPVVLQRGDPPKLEPSGFGPVDADTLDITPAGIHGMAGNVAEWTGENELNPSVPMNPRSPLVIGGSFRTAGAGAKTREWVESRSLRRDDLGFRVAYEPR